MERRFLKILCLIKRKNELLVQEVGGAKTGKLYRPIGGTIKFGEHSIATLKREMKEEIKSNLSSIRLMGVIENIFKYYDRSGKMTKVHEIDFVYSAVLNKKVIYKKKIVIGDGNNNTKFELFWVPVSDLRNGRVRLVPSGLKRFLTNI